MKFIADLHIHSKYSRATAKNLDLENLYYAAQIKGISLVGTGDFTHPAWMEELETKLEEKEPGLFGLKEDIAAPIDERVPSSCKGQVRFILQAEISNIYKKDGRVRKNHNLIYLPDLETAKAFNGKLDAIGNIKSDGRPILGLDARNLLEILLETSDQGFLVPAHIWTPWFSMFGSKSGFDTIEQCFGDLSPHIFACETGLSSDPPMNWRVKDLDRITLISNSDAHSPGFLGRNASVFDTDLAYWAIRRALERKDNAAFQGTLDMYPDQGKYHWDGHRKCNVSLNPDDTAKLGGICPECGKPMTLGVLYRVRELADRPEGYVPEQAPAFSYVVPLADILSEIFGVGPKTKKVTGYYDKAIEALGPELGILRSTPIDTIETSGVPLLARAVEKMRQGDLYIEPGFDGEFGKVKLFTREEKESILGQGRLALKLPPQKAGSRPNASPKKQSAKRESPKKVEGGEAPAPGNTWVPPEKTLEDKGLLTGLNPEQERAVFSEARQLLIQAGPGTGKTRTLTAKIAWLIETKRVAPDQILALTFTNKAAKELSQRIAPIIKDQGGRERRQPGPMAATFHSFCLWCLREYTAFSSQLMDEEVRLYLLEKAVGESGVCTDDQGKAKGVKQVVKTADQFISRCKQQLLGPDDSLEPVFRNSDWDQDLDAAAIYRAYDRICQDHQVVYFEDLILRMYQALTQDGTVMEQVCQRFGHVFVDEYQDLNQGQYELVKLLAQKAALFVIGDPDQSIYAFRGSDHRFFDCFQTDYPGCEKIRLMRNYRSTQTILDASFQMISGDDNTDRAHGKIYAGQDTAQKLVIKETASDQAEAVAVGKMIEGLVGGLSLLSMDTGAGHAEDMDGAREYSFGDFAVLYRTRKQCQVVAEVFEKAGIPFQTADQDDWQEHKGIKAVIVGLKHLMGRPGVMQKASLNSSAHPVDGVGSVPGGNLAGKTSLELVEAMGKWLNPGETDDPDPAFQSAWQRLVSKAQTYPDPDQFLDHLALDRDVDVLVDGVEKVSLMTLHAAKGLEFPVVFVIGCEQGLIPFARDGKTVDNLGEERRLFYVGMTRAMDILCLTYAQKRRIYGLLKSQKPSCFIEDIEKELARHKALGPGPGPKKKTEVQLELF